MKKLLFLTCIWVLCILVGCSSKKITDRDIQSVDTSVAEQRQLILAFEKQLQCDLHSPCFDSAVDGAFERNPRASLERCRYAKEKIDTVLVPDKLPERVRDHLAKSKDFLKEDIENRVNYAEHVIEGKPRLEFSKAPTCDAYALVEEVNKAYLLTEMMKGQYINCTVLSTMIPKKE